MAHVSMERVRQTYKQRDSWWTVLLVDPVAGRLVQIAVGRAWLTPTRLTVASFIIGMTAAVAFGYATPGWLVVGAVLYYLSFAVDCVDGKIARLRGQRSVVGSWLDFLLDRVRVFVCTVALFSGLYHLTGDDRFLFAATGVVFLSLIGYLNGAETDRAKARMAGPDGVADERAPAAGPGAGMPSRVQRLRAVLHRHRIRMNLVSAVEFEMALFVVAPLVAAAAGATAVLVVAVVAAVLLVGFEAVLMVRFWLSARAYDRTGGGLVPAPRREDRPGESAPARTG